MNDGGSPDTTPDVTHTHPSPRNFSRRDFLKAAGLVTAGTAVAACAPNSTTSPENSAKPDTSEAPLTQITIDNAAQDNARELANNPDKYRQELQSLREHCPNAFDRMVELQLEVQNPQAPGTLNVECTGALFEITEQFIVIATATHPFAIKDDEPYQGSNLHQLMSITVSQPQQLENPLHRDLSNQGFMNSQRFVLIHVADDEHPQFDRTYDKHSQFDRTYIVITQDPNHSLPTFASTIRTDTNPGVELYGLGCSSQAKKAGLPVVPFTGTIAAKNSQEELNHPQELLVKIPGISAGTSGMMLYDKDGNIVASVSGASKFSANFIATPFTAGQHSDQLQGAKNTLLAAMP